MQITSSQLVEVELDILQTGQAPLVPSSEKWQAWHLSVQRPRTGFTGPARRRQAGMLLLCLHLAPIP